MAVTVHLPENVERAYAAAARDKGISVDALVKDVLISHVPVAEMAQGAELIEENGIPVLRTGQPLEPSIVNDTLDAIRRERDLGALGQRGVSIFLDTSVLVPAFLVDHPHHAASIALFLRNSRRDGGTRPARLT